MAVQQTQALPPQYVEDLQRDLGTQLTALTAAPLATDKFAPTVAGQDQAQLDAYKMATTQGQGIGAFQPYITQAGAYDTAAAGLSGAGAYKPFMSPYQQDVIDATLAEYDSQAAQGLAGIGQQAAMSGNLGGGREGVMRAQYQNQSDMNRAMLEAQLLQGGFQNAQTAANQAFTQTQQLGADQQRMATLVPGLQGSDISTLGQAGRGQQLYEQSILDQQREANRLAAYEPYERLGYMGAGMGNVMGGAMGQYTSQVTPNQSPLQQALGIASLGVGAYTGLGGKIPKIFG